MASISILTQRFSELVSQLDEAEASKRQDRGPLREGFYVDNDKFLNWTIKARNLLSKACGKNSEHYRDSERYERPSGITTNYAMMNRLRAVFLAAKEDYEGGYLNSIRNLVQAEVFDSELEQASELHGAGYILPAAVVAGVVLETTLRQMCTDMSIPIGKLDKMNADLAKAGAYNSLVQKQITALAGIRNSAARGHPEDFTDTGVANMISQIRAFVSSQL